MGKGQARLPRNEKAYRTRNITREMHAKIASLAGKWDDPVSIHVLSTLTDLLDVIQDAADNDYILSIEAVTYHQAELPGMAKEPPGEPKDVYSDVDDIPF